MSGWWVTVEKYELGDVPGLGECAIGEELARLPPGTWRVTVHDDGKVDVVPLTPLGHLWVSVPAALRGSPIWADVPQPEDDR